MRQRDLKLNAESRSSQNLLGTFIYSRQKYTHEFQLKLTILHSHFECLRKEETPLTGGTSISMENQVPTWIRLNPVIHANIQIDTCHQPIGVEDVNCLSRGSSSAWRNSGFQHSHKIYSNQNSSAHYTSQPKRSNCRLLAWLNHSRLCWLRRNKHSCCCGLVLRVLSIPHRMLGSAQ